MKIPSATRKQSYELTYLTGLGLTSDEQKAVADKILTSLKKHKGTVETTEDWGKKVLAYTIKKEGKKHNEAIFTHLVFEINASKVTDFEKDIYLMPEVIRHLLVIAEEADREEEDVDGAMAYTE